MSYGFGLLVEGMVAILLVLTICYCIPLNRRLKELKADEKTLKSTIADLITATGNSERAVAGLKATARESEVMLGERLRAAERLIVDLENATRAGEGLVYRIGRAVAAGRGLADPAPPSDPKAVVAAAQAIAERARQRASGLAA